MEPCSELGFAACGRLLKKRIVQVGSALEELQLLLEGTVRRTEWVTQYQLSKDFGIGDPQDPYVCACRAECMLAALLLFVEGTKVKFIDAEGLEVLQGAPTPNEIQAVVEALA